MAKIIGEGITFDDVLLVPAYSEVTPNMVDLTTKLTNKITLNIQHGYSDRTSHGYRNGKTGRYRDHSQKHVYRSTG